MMELPAKYKEEMKRLLGTEYDAYLESFTQKHYAGLRVNTSKISVEEFLKRFPYELKPVPWTTNGFYYNSEDPVTTHPFYYAGLYYIQEPSAMLPGAVMPVEEGDRVIDLCAAPGGKSTELGSKLKGTGILVSNDISSSRCQALARNIERFGIPNAIVCSMDPKELAKRNAGYFDKVLVDAPCSGEGMFRKEPSLIKAWEERDSSYYVPIQKSIVESALKLLRDGGILVYSTCTFSRCEDEEIIAYAKEICPELKVLPIESCEGFVRNEYGTRLFPHRIAGEGHFVSMLQKGDGVRKNDIISSCSFDYDSIHVCFPDSHTEMHGTHAYAVPNGFDTKGIRVIRSGVQLCEVKKERREPDGALALVMKENDCENVLNFIGEDPRIRKYLKGETIDIRDFSCKDGYALVCVEGYPLGFAKITKGLFKNKYPKNRVVR